MSFQDVQHVLDAALGLNAIVVAYKNSQIECFVRAIPEVTMWRLTHGSTSPEPCTLIAIAVQSVIPVREQVLVRVGTCCFVCLLVRCLR